MWGIAGLVLRNFLDYRSSFFELERRLQGGGAAKGATEGFVEEYGSEE